MKCLKQRQNDFSRLAAGVMANSRLIAKAKNGIAPSLALCSPGKDEKQRNGDEGSQLENRRVTSLKRKNRDCANTKDQTASNTCAQSSIKRDGNTSHPAAPTGLSSQGSLEGPPQPVYLSPAVDLERAKAVYGPVKGPVRMLTYWLPANLSVSQMEPGERVVGPHHGVQAGGSRPEDVTREVPKSKVRGKRSGTNADSDTKRDALGSLELSSCNNGVTPIIVESYGGYRSALATHGFHQGSYMYEVKIDCDVTDQDGFGIRFGWATKHHELERILHQPVAAIHGDGYGFNVVNKGGNVFYSLHKGKREELPISKSKKNAVKKGDVFGVYLHLGSNGREFETKVEDIVLFKKTGRDHIKSPGPDWLDQRTALEGSYMELFWNGVSQGRVFQDAILESTYYPMVSLYTNMEILPDGDKDARKRARVIMNFRSETWCGYPCGKAKSLEDKIV